MTKFSKLVALAIMVSFLLTGATATAMAEDNLDWVKEYPKQCEEAYKVSKEANNDSKLIECYAKVKSKAVEYVAVKGDK